MRACFSLLVTLLCFQFANTQTSSYVQILGIAQDGGYPHAGCQKQCCAQAWQTDSLRRYVVSFALVDREAKKWWLFEATPDIKYQFQYFKELSGGAYPYLPAGIFITHAHIGHYTGLMQLGREVMNTKDIPVYVLPRMKQFLETNGPWSQLVTLKNISLQALNVDSVLTLNEHISIQTFTVPHRDEYSETAGFKIITPKRKYLFIPDIDKWEKWEKNIVEEVKAVDIALLDGTFFSADELPGRKMSEVPHPLISETMALFKDEDAGVKSKIYFIHFNHTNPMLWNRDGRKEFAKGGFGIAQQGEIF